MHERGDESIISSSFKIFQINCTFDCFDEKLFGERKCTLKGEAQNVYLLPEMMQFAIGSFPLIDENSLK